MLDNKTCIQIKEHIRSALHSAKRAHDTLAAYADVKDTIRIETGAAFYALMGLQSIRAAEVLYQSTAGDDSDDTLESIFLAYETFCSELVSVLAENESPQWVFIHYNDLMASAEPIGLDLNESCSKEN